MREGEQDFRPGVYNDKVTLEKGCWAKNVALVVFKNKMDGVRQQFRFQADIVLNYYTDP